MRFTSVDWLLSSPSDLEGSGWLRFQSNDSVQDVWCATPLYLLRVSRCMLLPDKCPLVVVCGFAAIILSSVFVADVTLVAIIAPIRQPSLR